MQTKMILKRLIILLSSALILGGCTSPGKNMIPKGGSMTMTQIYDSETTGGYADAVQNQKTSVRSQLSTMDADNTNYVGLSQNKLGQEFKTLPDPEIPMYLYPHFVHANGESYPKPGMMTAFFLYKRNHFELPSEA